jgi:uncharacterized protein involved in type VI secretion and phage assembly
LSDLGALHEALFGRTAEARLYGVAVGIVTNNQDPDGHGRVKVKCPWLSDTHESFWARVVTPMAGKDRGLYLLPEVDDEVLIAFEHGAPGFAYVLGSLWNGRDTPPESNDRGQNNHRMLKSRSGHVLRFDDTSGDERIEIVDRSGGNRIVIQTSTNSIVIEAAGNIEIRSHAGALTLSGHGVEIKSTAGVTIAATQTIDVTASGPLTLKGATIDLN